MHPLAHLSNNFMLSWTLLTNTLTHYAPTNLTPRRIKNLDLQLAFWDQWGFLLACLASIWINNSITSAWMLMGGVAASRLGLWMFDLGVMQLMQDQVSEADRCIVGGVQSSLQSMLDLLTYVMGMVVSDPRYFGQLVILSFIVVSSAAMLYTFHCYRVRKHLLHLDKILAKINWLVNSL